MTVNVQTQSRTALQAFCSEHYGLENVQARGVLDGGMFARPQLLETERGRLVLRSHATRPDAEAFRFQAEAIQSASRGGVGCAEVTPTLAGAWSVSAAHGPAVIALHRYVEGDVLGWNQWRTRSRHEAGFLEGLGRCVGRLHQVLAHARPGGNPELADSEPPIRFDRLGVIRGHWEASVEALLEDQRGGEAHNAIRRLRSRMEGHWDRLEHLVSEREVASLPRQVVHGDVSPVNLVWRDGGAPSFIDWDVVHVGWRLYDALGDVLNRTPDGCIDENRFQMDHVVRYLSGYEAGLGSPLSPAERDAVQPFCLARQLEDLRQRVATITGLDRDRRRLYAELIAMRVDMMDQIASAEFRLSSPR